MRAVLPASSPSSSECLDETPDSSRPAPGPQVRRSGDRLRTIVCTVKNEGPFILEWLAYHRLIGFNRFVIFSNDCTDGTDAILDTLDAAGLVHHFDNSRLSPDLPEDPQGRAYTRANAMKVVRESDWIMVIDGDEFLQVKVGDGSLGALLSALPEGADAIGVPWRVFGSGGVTAFTGALQIDAFRRAAPRDFAASPNHLAIKTLFRPDLVQRLGIHRPVYKGSSGTARNPLLFVNGSGADVTTYFLRGRWSMPPMLAGSDLAQVNHYMIRSHEVFLMKKWRGTANSANADRINFDYFDRYNSNHDEDAAMAPWVGPVAAEIARLKAEVPGLAALHDAALGAYASRIAELKAVLEHEAPEEFRRLFDPATVAGELQAQQQQIAGLRAQHGSGGPVQLIRQAEQLSGAPESDPADPNDLPAETGPAAPGWLVDLRTGPSRRGFYQSFEETGLHFVQRDSDRLVVSFDNLSAANSDPVGRQSWGYGFVRDNGWSHLGVFAYASNWFREEALLAHLAELAKQGFFAKFREVTMIGTSMGAYAATALAPLAPGCRVVAFSPQSTLKKKLVPWEKRFSSGRKADWTGRFADGAKGAAAASRVWLIYDPRVEGDLRHAERYEGSNILRLRARYADHKTALFLRRADLLSTVVREAVEGRLTEGRFYELYRQGRGLPWYLNGVANRIAASGRPARMQVLADYLRHTDRPQAARALQMRHPQLLD